MPADSLEALRRDVVVCRRCPRLLAHREQAARERPRRFRNETYWARPVPGFGDPDARLLVVGLAPAAHGANRTGRMFTGDVAGGAADFLMGALYRAGFANQPTSRDPNDGLRLTDAYLTAIVRCVPPQNRPYADEIAKCSRFLDREFQLLRHVRIVLALGGLAFDNTRRLLERFGAGLPSPKPRFAHGAVVTPGRGLPELVGSYHPSRQNTQTGRLSRAMLEDVLAVARARLDAPHDPT